MRWLLKTSLVVIVSGLSLSFATAQREGHSESLKGDKAYKDKNYTKAESDYRSSVERRGAAKDNYNLGNATYQLENYEEARKLYETAAQNALDQNEKSQAYYNLGNAHFKAGDWEKSVEAYKNALRLNPGDAAAKHNLAQARRRIPPPPPPQENQQNQDQQKQDQQQQDQQQQQQSQPNQDKQKQQNKPAKPQDGDEKELTRKEAEDLLKIMDQEEKKVMNKMRQSSRQACNSEKDW